MSAEHAVIDLDERNHELAGSEELAMAVLPSDGKWSCASSPLSLLVVSSAVSVSMSYMTRVKSGSGMLRSYS